MRELLGRAGHGTQAAYLRVEERAGGCSPPFVRTKTAPLERAIQFHAGNELLNQQARHDQRAAPTRLGAQGCFELVSGPLDYVVELLAALGEHRHHHGIDRLIAISRTDFARAGDRDLLVAPRRVPYMLK